jgi:carboxymethylenebutenolidase
MRRWILPVACVLFGCSSQDETGPAAGSAAAGEARQPAAAVPARTEPVATPVTEVAPRVGVQAQSLTYGTSATGSLTGYFVLPEDLTEPIPGVVMIHGGWGLDDGVRAMARRLAGEGYAVLAVDLYGGQAATSPAEAEQLMQAVAQDPAAALDNLEQAAMYLDQFALAPSIGVLGFSLGGGWALQTGLALTDVVDAVVMYYGETVPRERLEQLGAPLLGLFAQKDQSIPVASVQRFESQLKELGKEADITVYPAVDHDFANPASAAYDQAAAERAWDATVKFLDAELR